MNDSFCENYQKNYNLFLQSLEKYIKQNEINENTNQSDLTSICECKAFEEIRTSTAVDSPSHYQGKTLEVIDVIEEFELNYNLGNVLKYILRAGKKGSKDIDLMKALWYLKRELD